MSFATLSNVRASRVDLVQPLSGCWFATVDLETAAPLSGSVSLAFGGVTWKGAIVSGGDYAGASRFQLVGGAGGWRKRVAAKSYSSSGGVRVALVAGDLAREVGETLADQPSGSLGPFWVRFAGSASSGLESATSGAWWVGADGRTNVGSRASSSTSTSGVLVALDVGLRVATFASETVGEFEPGRSMAIGPFASFRIGLVRHIINADSIRTELHAVRS